MATWMTHFRVADIFIDIIGEDKLDLPCFVFGNIAPDCGLPDSDGLTYTPGKEISHFAKGNDFNCEEFKNIYLSEPSDTSKKSFYLGYYLHLLTDELWISDIYRPQRDRYMPQFPDKKSFAQAVRRDWFDQDRLFLKYNPDFRAFHIFADIQSFPNRYLDFFPDTAFDWQLTRIRNSYMASGEDPEREYMYLTEETLNAFVESAGIRLKDRIMILL